MVKAYPCVVYPHGQGTAYSTLEEAKLWLRWNIMYNDRYGPYALGIKYRRDGEWDSYATPMSEEDIIIVLSTEEEW